MDAAYFGCIFIMFLAQVWSMLSAAFQCAEHTTKLADKDERDEYEATQLIFGSWYHSITQEGVQYAYTSRLVRAIRWLNEFGTLGEDPWIEQGSGLGILFRVLGVAFYILLFPLSFLLIQGVYDNSKIISERVSFGVPFIVTVIRICIPTYLVPFFLDFEGWDEETKFKQVIFRMFALKMYTINQLLFNLHRTTANCGQLRMQFPGDKAEVCICREIFIGMVYWRQELMDVVFHIALDAYATFQRFKMRPRPVFDQEVLAERCMELLYRQGFIWTATPYSPMIAALGLGSTGLLLVWQIKTVGLSYEPPIHGWGFHPAKDIFMKGMLATFVLSLIPTWTWLHSHNQCGPYTSEATPYDYLSKMLRGTDQSVSLFLDYAGAPTVTWALLWLSMVFVLYYRKMWAVARKKLKEVARQHHLEYFDKSQLLRVEGCMY